MSVMDEAAHVVNVAVELQLLEMSSITTPNQTILNVYTKYSFLKCFLGKIWQFYQSAIMKQNQNGGCV